MTKYDSESAGAIQEPTLTEFLLARIAEDETAARRADMSEYGADGWEKVPPTGKKAPTQVRTVANRHGTTFAVARTYDAAADHIARHDPARVLARCDADRRIVMEAAALLDSWDHAHGGTPDFAAWPDVNRRERHQARQRLATLASVYADHPDYQTEWRA
jgi:hypothetical protein